MSSAFGAAKNRMSGSASQQVSPFYLLVFLFVAKMHLLPYYADMLMEISFNKKDFHSEFV